MLWVRRCWHERLGWWTCHLDPPSLHSPFLSTLVILFSVQLEDGSSLFDYSVGLNDIIQLMIRPLPSHSVSPAPQAASATTNGTNHAAAAAAVQNGNGTPHNGSGNGNEGVCIQNGNGTPHNGSENENGDVSTQNGKETGSEGAENGVEEEEEIGVYKVRS